MGKLYSSTTDAEADRNPWKFCNYNDPGVGFPRDCGKNGKVNRQWNSDCSSDMQGCRDRGGVKATWRIVRRGWASSGSSSGSMDGSMDGCGRRPPHHTLPHQHVLLGVRASLL